MVQGYTESTPPPIGHIKENERLLAVLSHITALFFSFVGPLIIYLIKKDESQYVREHARESLNFQITMAILYVISFLLLIVIVGILMFMVLGLVHLILVIVATVKAADNQLYRYPFSIRLIR